MTGVVEDCEKLSCVTVSLVDSWSALFHRSTYCLLGGLCGRKQVSLQIALENNMPAPPPRPLCHSVSHDGPRARLPLTALL